MLIPLTVPAQELVVHRYVSREPDHGFEEILYLAAGVALIQHGLSSNRAVDTGDLILVTRYAKNSGTVELDYNLSREATPGSTLGRLAIMLPIDQGMDRAIGEAVWTLFEAAGTGGSPSPNAKIHGLLGEASTLKAPALLAPVQPSPAMVSSSQPTPVRAPSAGLLPVESGSPPRTKTGSVASGPSTIAAPAGFLQPELLPALVSPAGQPTVEPDSLPQTGTSTNMPDGYTASVSMAGIMFVGEVMEYLRYAVSGRLGFGLSWKQPSRSMDLEAKVSLSQAFNDIGVAGGPLYLGTAGFGLTLGTGTEKVYRLGAGISGGAAFLKVPGDSGNVSRTVPYLELGVSMRVPLGVYLSLIGDLLYLAVIDRDILIMGISPAIRIGREF